MENNWAAENLQTIRTLMERSAIYRRALAPISTYVGIVGIVAAAIGWQLKVESSRTFAVFWLSTSIIALVGAFLLVRRQALKEREAFWSPPTRRIAQAMVPALLVGLLFGLIVPFSWMAEGDEMFPPLLLVPIWTLLYGLALHSAGFFMPRGVRVLGWAFVVIGMSLWYPPLLKVLFQSSSNLLMGAVFGLSHLAYGIYLYFTEPRKNEA